MGIVMFRHLPWTALPAVSALRMSLSMTASSEGAFLRNLHMIDDESRGYRLDIVDAGENINQEAPPGTRTCKYGRNHPGTPCWPSPCTWSSTSNGWEPEPWT